MDIDIVYEHFKNFQFTITPDRAVKKWGPVVDHINLKDNSIIETISIFLETYSYLLNPTYSSTLGGNGMGPVSHVVPYASPDPDEYILSDIVKDLRDKILGYNNPDVSLARFVDDELRYHTDPTFRLKKDRLNKLDTLDENENI